MPLSRRSLLKSASLAAAGLLLPPLAGMRASMGANDGAWRRLRAAATQAMLLDGEQGDPKTTVWAYEDSVPGPLLRLPRGKRTRFRLENGLVQPTSIHWHGLRIDNAMDGVPGLTQEAVTPGDSFAYDFTPPDAGTFWYHSHNRSWEQVARGLYGALVVEEDEPPAVDQDLVLAIDDWRIADDGQLHEASFGSLHDNAHAGRLGNWMTVNGQSLPEFAVSAGDRLRLRLLNAANARILSLDLAPEEATLIALDGHPIAPRRLTVPLVLAPGQRADLIVDLIGEPGGRSALKAMSGGEPLEVALFVYDGQEGRNRVATRPTVRLPAWTLPSLDLANLQEQGLLMEGGAMGRMESARYQGREMNPEELAAFGKAWTFNGVAGDSSDLGQPLMRIERGRSAAIDIFNDTRFPHAMHLHGHHFQVLQIDQEPVASEERRDTILLNPGQRMKLGFVADNPGQWLFHCHMLEHSAGGMITWLEVET